MLKLRQIVFLNELFSKLIKKRSKFTKRILSFIDDSLLKRKIQLQSLTKKAIQTIAEESFILTTSKQNVANNFSA
ncbi:MAG: hypothetical protein IJ262_01325 [Clostridia bacterium]|nr:hypothetical protein [Clostridia bacterium]